MVAGDLVNTASRDAVASPSPGQVLVGRVDPAGDRADDRLRGRRHARAEGQDRACTRSGGRCGSSRAPAARSSRRGWRRRSSAATASCARSRTCSTPAPRSGGRTCLGDRDRRDRQVAAGVGVLQVLRRPRPDRLLAPRPLPLLRRGRDLLGARRHGADALPDHRGRGAGLGAREAGRGARGARPRSRGAPVRRAARRAPARPRGGQRLRPRGPVRGLADCSSSGWRTSTRPCSRSRTCSGPTRRCSTSSSTCSSGRGRARCSWSPLARPELVERRPTWGAGKRNFTSIYLEPLSPQAMARPARRARSRAARHAARPDPRPRRGRAAVRGRDGADAARPRPARPRGQRLPADRGGRGARGAGDAARADRRPPGRPDATTSGAWCRTAPVLGKTFTRQALAALTRARPRRRARRRPRGARAQGGAVDPGRPALARARPVRIPAGPHAPGRLRDARRSATAATRHLAAAAYLEQAFPDDDEIVEVLASHYLDAYNAAPDAEDAAGIRARARALTVRARQRAASLGAPAEAQRYYTQAADLTRRAARTGRAARRRPARWRCGRRRRTRRRRCPSGPGRCTRRRARSAPPPASRCACRGSIRPRAASVTRSSAWSGPTRCCRPRSPARTSPCWRRDWPARCTSPAMSRERPSWSSSRSTSPRRSTSRPCSSAAGR